MKDLLQRWTDLVGRSDRAEAAGVGLIERWSQPHRHYHGLGHLRAVLDAVDLLAAEAHDLDAVRLAAWFHDAVYEGHPGADERASADLARQVLLGLGRPDDEVADVARLVLLTTTHTTARGDADGAVLCDADLAVLGGDPDGYAAYASAVRLDYAHVSDEEFRQGRMAVLERLLDTRPLYRTALARGRWEDSARRNLTTELTLLRASNP